MVPNKKVSAWQIDFVFPNADPIPKIVDGAPVPVQPSGNVIVMTRDIASALAWFDRWYDVAKDYSDFGGGIEITGVHAFAPAMYIDFSTLKIPESCLDLPVPIQRMLANRANLNVRVNDGVYRLQRTDLFNDGEARTLDEVGGGESGDGPDTDPVPSGR